MVYEDQQILFFSERRLCDNVAAWSDCHDDRCVYAWLRASTIKVVMRRVQTRSCDPEPHLMAPVYAVTTRVSGFV